MEQDLKDFKPKGDINFVGIGLTILVLILLAIFVDIGALRVWVEQAGVWGPAVFILLKISTIVIAPLSGSPLYPLVGLLFGFWPGILYVAIGDFLGYTIAFYISRIFGKKVVLRLISNNEEGVLSRVMNHIGTPKGFLQACFTGFAMPEILAYSAGLSRLSYISCISILWPLTTFIATILVFFGSILGPSTKSLFIGFIVPAVGAVAMITGGYLFFRDIEKDKLSAEEK